MAKKKKFDYFDAFEKLSELIVSESNLLVETVENFTTSEALRDNIERSHVFEHAGDDINHDVYKNTAVDFMPPIDREDIISLAHALDNVLDNIEDVIQHLYMYNVDSIPEDAILFAKLIKKSCESLDKAMEDFRNFKKSKKFQQLIVDVNTNEEEGDQLYIAAMRRLHTVEREDPIHVLVWSRTYTDMEKCCDTCEHVADAMSTIVLKNV